MAFRNPSSNYQQIDPLFAQGYPYPNKYHNVGQLQTPYQGKRLGVGGDYGPPQRTKYYTVDNPVYPYVLDKDFRAEEYLPTEGCLFGHPGYFPCYESEYPKNFVAPNYFSPKVYTPRGHITPHHPIGQHMYRDYTMAFQE